MRTKRKEIQFKNLLMLLLAGVINALGVTIFLFPVRLYDSGISGLSMLLDQITPQGLSLSVFLLLLNIPIFLFGLKKQGLTFTLYSVFTVAVYSLSSYLIMNVLSLDTSPLAQSDLLLCAVFGGVISGIGSGLTIRNGGAIDGIDVLSVTFSKKIGISIGSFVLVFNTVLYIICGIIIRSWILPLYSIITYFIGSKTVDYIIEGFDSSRCAMIVTTKADEICKGLSGSFKENGTFVNAIGGHNRQQKQILYFVVNRFQVNRLKNLVREIDENAFISFVEVSEVIRRDRTQKATDG